MNNLPNILNITYTHLKGGEEPVEIRVEGSICEICLLIQALDAVQPNCSHKQISKEVSTKAREFRSIWINRNRKEDPPKLNQPKEKEQKEKSFSKSTPELTTMLDIKSSSPTEISPIIPDKCEGDNDDTLMNKTFSPTQWRSCESVLHSDDLAPQPKPPSIGKMAIHSTQKTLTKISNESLINNIRKKLIEINKSVDELSKNIDDTDKKKILSPAPRRAFSSGQLSSMPPLPSPTGRFSLNAIKTGLPRTPLRLKSPAQRTTTATTTNVLAQRKVKITEPKNIKPIMSRVPTIKK